MAIKCWNKKHTPVHLIFIFFCKNISLSTFSAKRRDLLAVTMSPAVEKTRSLGTDVPWTARLRWANLAMCGYLCSLLFHHASGSSSTEMQPVALYEVTSSWMMSDKGFVLLSSVLNKSANTIAMADFFWGGEVSDGPGSAPEDELAVWPSLLWPWWVYDKINILEMLITTNSSHGSKKLFSTGQWGIEKYYNITGTNRLNRFGSVKNKNKTAIIIRIKTKNNI